MSQELSAEQFFSQLRGSMDLVVEACALLVAKHQEKGALLGQLSALGKPVVASDPDLAKHYKLGVLRALGSIADRVGNLEAQIQSVGIDPADRH